MKMRAVMDSGAADNVLPVDMAVNFPLLETDASRRGQVFATADGGVLPNKGERMVTMTTQDGTRVCGKYQVAGVTKALNSIAKICDRGNEVVFRKDCGFIRANDTGKKTWFKRNQDVYHLETWLWTGNPEGPFGRQE